MTSLVTRRIGPKLRHGADDLSPWAPVGPWDDNSVKTHGAYLVLGMIRPAEHITDCFLEEARVSCGKTRSDGQRGSVAQPRHLRCDVLIEF